MMVIMVTGIMEDEDIERMEVAIQRIEEVAADIPATLTTPITTSTTTGRQKNTKKIKTTQEIKS
jgi:hypothetical protein